MKEMQTPYLGKQKGKKITDLGLKPLKALIDIKLVITWKIMFNKNNSHIFF